MVKITEETIEKIRDLCGKIIFVIVLLAVLAIGFMYNYVDMDSKLAIRDLAKNKNNVTVIKYKEVKKVNQEKFANDSERLEFALTSLRTIENLAEKLAEDRTEQLQTIADMAGSTVRLIERSQHEPAVELNDLLMELHEER